MKKNLLQFACLISTLVALGQSPGGVSKSDIWAKVVTTDPGASVFQYTDYSATPKIISVGSPVTPSLLNYNYSYTYNPNSYVSFLSKVETAKDATIFIVTQPAPPANPSDIQALMSVDWAPGTNVPPGTVNEQAFSFATTTFEKPNMSLTYPANSGGRPNARINTLVWHTFNSRKIANSFGANGESSIAVGKQFGSTVNFTGEIPEFIVYRRALNQKEKSRVESYLAIKYGITLQGNADYYSSRNEIFWHKENNLFNKRIFGLGRDSNSGLYQRQATTAHDNATEKKLIFWTGPSLLANNYLNTAYIDDQNFVTIGDNNASETPNQILNCGIQKIDRVWLTERFGPSAHQLETALKYKVPTGTTLQPDETYWLIIDRTATNTNVSDFNNATMEVYSVSSFTNGYAEYSDLKWGSATQAYNQFTFGIGPKMVIVATPLPIACAATTGNVDFNIKGGQGDFVVNVNGTDNAYNLQFSGPNRDFSLGFATGNYIITVTDGSGFVQSTTFSVTATPGMLIDLGPDQVINTGASVTLNAAAGVTAPNVTYEWHFVPSGGLPDPDPFSTQASVNVTESGTYTCVILNTLTGCSLEDSIVISVVDPLVPGNNGSQVYPNPSTGSFSVAISLDDLKDANTIIYDISGKTLISDYHNGASHYENTYQLLTTGIYFVRITANGYTATHKLIIN